MLRRGAIAADRYERTFEIIERNTEALTRLVEDLLDVSNIIKGRIQPRTALVDLRDVAAQAIATVMPAAEAKGVHLRTILGGDAALIVGDRDRVLQIIWNLLSNAVRFTPPAGTIELKVECGAKTTEVTVTDTGIGIDASLLPHVFERFRQGATVSRRDGGLGLGLAIARELAELHGGSISAHSHGEGRGAMFTLRIPTAEVRQVDAVAMGDQTRGAADEERLTRDACAACGHAGALSVTPIRRAGKPLLMWHCGHCDSAHETPDRRQRARSA
jgi:signal transduction histidine kinase